MLVLGVHPLEDAAAPLEVAFRARRTPGTAVEVDPVQVFEWRDRISVKDDSSQVEWVQKLDAEVVRGTARIVAPGRVEVDGTGLDYDELLVSTGSVPTMPPIEGLEMRRPGRAARERA